MHRPTRVLLLMTILASLIPLTASAQKKQFFARRAKVTLRNGSVIVGIVRNKKLYEIERKGLFVAVDLDQLQAQYEAAKDAALRAKKPMPRSPMTQVGIRLWFVMGNEGYVFLPRHDIKSYKLEESVAEKEFKAIKRKAAERAERRRRRHAMEQKRRKEKEAREKKKKEEADQKKEGEGDKTKKSAADELKLPKGYEFEEDWIKAAKELLEKFPEKDGWGKDKKSYDWLKYKYQRTKGGTTTRTIVVNGVTRTVRIKRGIPRTKIENEFYQNYDLWVEAGKWNKAGKLDPAKLPVKDPKNEIPEKKPAK